MMEDRRQKREAALRAARSGRPRQPTPQTGGGKELFLFRTYVTLLALGTAFVISLVQTDATKGLTSDLRTAIAHQIPMSEAKRIGLNALRMVQVPEDLLKKATPAQTNTDPENTTTPPPEELEPETTSDDGEIP